MTSAADCRPCAPDRRRECPRPRPDPPACCRRPRSPRPRAARPSRCTRPRCRRRSGLRRRSGAPGGSPGPHRRASACRARRAPGCPRAGAPGRAARATGSWSPGSRAHRPWPRSRGRAPRPRRSAWRWRCRKSPSQGRARRSTRSWLGGLPVFVAPSLEPAMNDRAPHHTLRGADAGRQGGRGIMRRSFRMNAFVAMLWFRTNE
jgi:hypothetical protein